MGPSFLHQRANNITPFAHDLVASISVLTTDQFPPNGRWTHRNTHTALTHTHTRTWSSRKSWKWPQLCTLDETLGNRSAPLGGRKATEHPPMADVPSFISPVDAKFRASAGWRCSISSAGDAQMWPTFRQNKSLGHVKQLVKFRLLQLSIQALYLTLSKPWCVVLWKRLLLFRVAVIRLSRTTADDAQSYRSIAHASCIHSFFLFFARLWLWHQQQLSPFLFFSTGGPITFHCLGRKWLPSICSSSPFSAIFRLSAARTASPAVGRSFRSFHLFPGRVIDKCFHFGADFRPNFSSDWVGLKRSFVEGFKGYQKICLFVVYA